jgi:hypothetical protein
MRTLVDFYDEKEFSNLTLKIEETVTNDRSFKLSVFSVISHLDLIELLRNKKIEGFEINVEEALDYWRIGIRRTIERVDIPHGMRTLSGFIFLRKPDSSWKIWHILTTEDLDFQRNCVERLIDLLSPDVSRFFLTSNEIKSIFKRFEGTGYAILVKKAILYSHKEEGEISFKKLPYYLIFNEAEEKDMYVDKVEFVMRKNRRTALYGFVTRDGLSKFMGGDVAFFYDKFLSLLASFAEDKRVKLSKKEKDKKTHELKNLALTFRKEMIRETGQNRRILDSLRRLSRGSVLVYHSNPYLHVSFLDFVDGSSCDIVVSSPDEISVIPSCNSSLASLMRVFNQLSKDFQEGEITEKGKKRVQFSEFFE